MRGRGSEVTHRPLLEPERLLAPHDLSGWTQMAEKLVQGSKSPPVPAQSTGSSSLLAVGVAAGFRAAARLVTPAVEAMVLISTP